MVTEWREREHEASDAILLRDAAVIQALRQCGLLKFFRLPYMRAKVRLLRTMLDKWDPDEEAFMLNEDPLHIELADIYFLTGFSRRGPVVSFRSRGQDPGALTVQDYIDVYYEEDTQKVASLVPIDKIRNLSMRAIVQTIVRLSGNASQHVALR